MERKLWLKKGKNFLLKGGLPGALIIVILMSLFVGQVMARDFQICDDKNLSIMGFIDQGVSIGTNGSSYVDTKSDFQAAIFQALLEAKLTWSPTLSFFSSVMFNADWAYPILRHSSNEWKDKGLDQSWDKLFILNHKRDDILKEMHLTWTPENWNIRLGKQIVVWGETDGYRLMDQINPLDSRRGISDVQFETTIIPIWLAKVVRYFRPPVDWMEELACEFVFNPNPTFRGNEPLLVGNDESGIWSPRVVIPVGGPYPFDYMYLGSAYNRIKRPGAWADDGFEYGLRLRALIHDKVITLNAFYGRDNDFVAQPLPLAPAMIPNNWDGRSILHPQQKGYYPLLRFVGATFTGDLSNLYVTALGGVAPVLRIESLYAHNTTFENGISPVIKGGFERHSEFRTAVGVDWKIWCRALNPRAAFSISPQVFHRHIMGHPGYNLTTGGGATVYQQDNFSTSLMINTTYFHNKIQPMIFWMRDITWPSNMIKAQIAYEPNDRWKYTLGTLQIFGTTRVGMGMDAMRYKDHVYFTIHYRIN